MTMSLYDAIETRISCRSYLDQPLDQATLDEIGACAASLSKEGDLRFVVVGPNDGGRELKLSGRMFTGGVSSYIALIGPDDDEVRERYGFFGEKLVLLATEMGLGTCWVAGTFDRDSVTVPLAEGEVIHDVIPIGKVPAKQPLAQRTIRAGLRRRNKKPEALYQGPTSLGEAPAWVRAGIDAVIKGPSAVNGQPVVFVDDGNGLRATLPHYKREVEFTDLGIAKLHFQLGAEHAGMPGTWTWGTDGRFEPSAR